MEKPKAFSRATTNLNFMACLRWLKEERLIIPMEWNILVEQANEDGIRDAAVPAELFYLNGKDTDGVQQKAFSKFMEEFPEEVDDFWFEQQGGYR